LVTIKGSSGSCPEKGDSEGFGSIKKKDQAIVLPVSALFFARECLSRVSTAAFLDACFATVKLRGGDDPT
jgi:hypothetical protein